MVTKRLEFQDLIKEDGKSFRLNTKVYKDEEIFRVEQEIFFHNSWTFLAHESQVEYPNDYMTTYIGRYPVILVRDERGKLRCFMNRCRHRGSLVCRAKSGNSRFFRCFYHGWSYSNEGKLVGVPDREGYPPDFDLDSMGLIEVPRLETYKGFVFASLKRDPPSLQDYLGNARPYIDLIVDKYPEGIEVAKGTHVYTVQGNWKLVLENSLDHYHAPFIHKSYFEAIGNQAGGRIELRSKNLVLYLGNGHGLDLMFRETDVYGHETNILLPGNRLDEEKAKWAKRITFHLLLFPNAILFDSDSPATTIRVVRPLSVNSTEVSSYCYVPKGVREEIKEKFLRVYERFYGPAGMGAPDDVEAIKAVDQGMEADLFHWNDLSRGLHREIRDHELKELGDFEVAGNGTDDTFYRAFYRWYVKKLEEVEGHEL